MLVYQLLGLRLFFFLPRQVLSQILGVRVRGIRDEDRAKKLFCGMMNLDGLRSSLVPAFLSSSVSESDWLIPDLITLAQ